MCISGVTMSIRTGAACMVRHNFSPVSKFMMSTHNLEQKADEVEGCQQDKPVFRYWKRLKVSIILKRGAQC